LWGCFDGDDIIGVIAIRPPCHIALLFVDKEYHRRGIARSLFMTVLSDKQVVIGHSAVTVNSSPYAVEAYRHLGFVNTDAEQLKNGIRYYPMTYTLNVENRADAD
jgi:GNAT superfamily N-acetyltransferase